MQNLIKQLQADGVPISGVGMESHFIVGEVPTTLVENFQAYADLGLEFAITELDIRMELPATDASYEQQKQDYYTVVNACMQVSACVGVTVWDWTDKVSFLEHSSKRNVLIMHIQYSWIPSTFPGYGDACPWDEVSNSETGVFLAFLIPHTVGLPTQTCIRRHCHCLRRPKHLVLGVGYPHMVLSNVLLYRHGEMVFSTKIRVRICTQSYEGELVAAYHLPYCAVLRHSKHHVLGVVEWYSPK